MIGLSRRQLLTTAMAVVSAGVAGPGALAAPGGRLFVPGYRSSEAMEAGHPLLDQPALVRAPAGWDGPLTLLAMLDLAAPTAPPRRAAYPVRGHGVALAPRAGVAVFAGMEGETVAALDPVSLDLVALARPTRADWRFGGHALTLPDGKHVAIAERAPASPAGADRAADLERMGGRIVIREAASLRPVAEFPSFGLRPHDIQLTDDGRHLVVANYGSTVADHQDPDGPVIPHVLAPNAAIIDWASGHLVERWDVDGFGAELRHLVAPSLSRVFAVMAKVEPASGTGPRDPAAESGLDYASAQPLRRVGGRTMPLLGEAASLARHGLSIAYDRVADAVLVSFPASHHVAVFDGASGRTRHLVDTAALGLAWPCGIALAPDRRHFLVTGYWGGLLPIEVGSHRPQAVVAGPTWWGHSHTLTG